MPRPQRATRKQAKYAESSSSDDSDDDVICDEGDESDDDFDPDEVTVPGGGKNMDAVKERFKSGSCSSEAEDGNGAASGSGDTSIATTSKVQTAPSSSKPATTTGSIRPPTVISSSVPPSKPAPSAMATAIAMSALSGGRGGPQPEVVMTSGPKGAGVFPLPFNKTASVLNEKLLNSLGGGALKMGGDITSKIEGAMGPAGGTGSSSGFNLFSLLQKTLQGVTPTSPYAAALDPNNPLLSWPGAAAGMNRQFNPASLWPGSGYYQPSYKQDPTPDEENEEEEEELGLADTFSDYRPKKLDYGARHPDPIVETASLGSVQPPDVWYKLKLPRKLIEKGLLSALQLEAVVYASQQHEQRLRSGERAGYLVGDGAGVGKGRTIAGIIYENWLRGRRRALWVSVSSDLKFDSERDLSDIGATMIRVHPLNKTKYAKLSGRENGQITEGVLYSTYSALIGESQSGGKFRTRLKQILDWCGNDFDGCVVFDECHRAKNLVPSGSSKPTKTALTVLEIQEKLPNARVVYASATGASEPKNMAYMTRLGIWGKGTPFNTFQDFISSVEKRGVGAMEIVAMDMKLRGSYIARQLSFHGVTFKIDEVQLTSDFRKIYDESVEWWVNARQKFEEAACLIDAEKKMKKSMWSQFWGAHQRFFKYLCIAAKVKHTVRIAREAVKYGKCVVIGLQSTGEARTLEALEKDDGQLAEFVSTAKAVAVSMVEKHFPAPDRNRIARILGLKTPNSFMKDVAELETSSPGGSQKRKRRQAAETSAKRMKMSNRDSTDSEQSSESDGEGSDDSDFTVTDDEKSEGGDGEASASGDPTASESDEENSSSDDFSDDSDNGIWVRTKRAQKAANGKDKKKKAKPKKKTKENGAASFTESQSYIPAASSAAGAGASNSVPSVGPSKDAIDRACQMKDELIKSMESLGERLPPNTLDQLIDELGGPENVAEMTGRKGRVISDDGGKVKYESRSSEEDVTLENLNMKEKERFMNGDKDVAIISEAASSGISLQSDKRVRNQRRRVHITLELPWSADRAIQQFGRTHRSNQANAPEYIFLISDLAGERRFASVVAKRLESLGALTHGDRRATESRDLSRFNIDNKYGRAALESTLKTVMGYEAPVVAPPKDYPGDFFKAVQTALIGVGCIVSDNGIASLEKDATTLPKFMNRILGMPVILQNKLFDYFTDTLGAIVSQAKRSGRYDLGILDLGSHGDKVTRVEKNVYESRHATGKAVTELHKVRVERGMSWQEAQEKYSTLLDDDEGFYVLKDGRNRMNRACAVLAVLRDPASLGKKKSPNAAIIVYRPNTGRQYKTEVLEDLKQKYKKVTPDVAQPLWDEQYKWSEKSCSHAFWLGQCRRMIVGSECDVGLRSKTYHVLSGSVLNVWTEVETVISAYSFNKANRLQVIRMRLDDDTRVIGTIIPNHCVEALKKALTEHVQAKEEEAKLQATPDKIVKSETTSNASEKEADGDGCVVTDMKPGTGVAVKSEPKRTRGAAKKILNGGDGDDESDDEEITVFSPFK